MESVAAQLADHIKRQVKPALAVLSLAVTIEETQRHASGDIVDTRKSAGTSNCFLRHDHSIHPPPPKNKNTRILDATHTRQPAVAEIPMCFLSATASGNIYKPPTDGLGRLCGSPSTLRALGRDLDGAL